MNLTVQQIADLVKGTVRGDGTLMIKGIAPLSEATSTDMSFLKDNQNKKTLAAYKITSAGAVLAPKGTKPDGKTIIEVNNILEALSLVLSKSVATLKKNESGIHPMAIVAKTAQVGKHVFVGAFSIVEDGAVLADGAYLLAQVYVGQNTKIGKDTFIYPQVVIRENSLIGERCVIHSGAVIGSDGYGFYLDNNKHNKIPQIGNVIIEDEVEIGAGTTIDRATMGSTLIRRGTKIDNLVQVAHNVDVGENSLLVAQVGIGGSCKLGPGVIMAGQSGVADHITIGAGSRIGGKTGVTQDVPPGSVLFGTPAQPAQNTFKQYFLIKKLSSLFKDVKKIKDKLNISNE